MPKTKQNSNQKIKLPLLVKIISILLILFALQILAMVFISFFLPFFAGYPIPENVNWILNLVFMFAVSVIIILVAIFLWKRKKFAEF